MTLFRSARSLVAAALTLCAVACSAPDAVDVFDGTALRVATFNASMSREQSGTLVAELAAGNAQAETVAAIVQRTRPDVLLLLEFDRDPSGAAIDLFRTRYLSKPQRGGEPIDYPFRYVPESNTGESSGLDLDGDGKVSGPGDAYGFGVHPGQYGFVVLSRYRIEASAVRSFRHLPWTAMPGHLMPEGFLSPDASAAMRLSSKNHVDVPLQLPDGRLLHLLASHPTPPVFDGPEDRNGRRNHDEIRFWAEYLDPARAQWIVDDSGVRGGLAPGAHFVLCGDLNCDPNDGDSLGAPVRLLLEHPRIDTRITPASIGAIAASTRDGGRNATHVSPPDADTSDFDDDRGPGNLRLDYVLPSNTLRSVRGGVFWPPPDHADAALVTISDHRLVWLDVR